MSGDDDQKPDEPTEASGRVERYARRAAAIATAALRSVRWSVASDALTRAGQLVRNLLRAVLALALFVLLFVSPALLVLVLVDSSALVTPEQKLVCGWIALSALITGINTAVVASSLWLSFGLVQAVVRRFDSLVCLGAAIVTIAIFPKVVPSTIAGVTHAAVELIFVIPPGIARKMNELGSLVVHLEGSGEFDFIYPMVRRFVSVVDVSYASLGAKIAADISAVEVVEACLLWFVLSAVLNEIVARNTLSTTRVVGARATRALLAFFKAHPGLSAKNAGFSLVVSTGIFLSLAAITSLPRLRQQDRPNEAVSSEALEKELRRLTVVVTSAATSAPLDDTAPNGASSPARPTTDSANPATVDDPSARPAIAPRANESADASSRLEAELSVLQKRVDALQAAYESANLNQEKAFQKYTSADYQVAVREDLASKWQSALDAQLAARRELDKANSDLRTLEEEARIPAEMDRQRVELAGLWNELTQKQRSLVTRLHSVQESMILSAVGAFNRVNVERRGSREERDHYAILHGWYREWTGRFRDQLGFCVSGVEVTNSRIANWRAVAGQALVRTATTSPTTRLLELNSAYRLASLAIDWCDRTTEDPVLPDPPSLGASLGPLGFLAGWLLDAASLPLALIVGLIGFGLLGSVISTFVKEQVATDQGSQRYVNDEIVTDLVGVILRGVSAAIVVFLAVQGGLAVLSGSGSEPNPYVLLLACFVAAVFSERVWRGAYKYLDERIGNSDADGGKRVEAAAKPSAAATADTNIVE